MGFSVSGAAAIVFVGMFIAFGMWHTASANGFERISEAQADRTDAVVEQRNTHVEIVSATYDSDADELTVRVNNTGASQLRLSATDLLVDGRYETGWEGNASVAGDGNTDLWLGGEQAEIVVSSTTQPDRVKVVTETSVADTAGVTSP